MQDLISIIVPIYNVQQYLHKCIDSILKQTYKEFEIILVDDGSPDECGSICEEYAQKDSRIKVIHKNNQGLGEARNTGLEVAKGKYVYFLDSDDWIEPNMLQSMLSEMQTEKADFVMCGFKKCTTGREPIIDHHTDVKRVFVGKEIVQNLLLPMVAQKSTVKADYTINMCVWTNLYKRDIIDKNSLCFLSEREYLSEDICFNLQYLLHVQKAVLLPDPFYCYRYNPSSLTCRYKGSEYSMLLCLYKKVGAIVDQVKCGDEIEFRKQRFFLTKTREILFRLANSNLSLMHRYSVCKQILSDATLQEVLEEYPLRNYAKKYWIPSILMKRKMALSTILLFYLTKRLRTR